MYNANKHENPKIVQRDAGEVRDEVPAKKGPKRLLMKAELRLLCLGIGRAHGIQISRIRLLCLEEKDDNHTTPVIQLKLIDFLLASADAPNFHFSKKHRASTFR
jgi:hypothetical protein